MDSSHMDPSQLRRLTEMREKDTIEYHETELAKKLRTPNLSTNQIKRMAIETRLAIDEIASQDNAYHGNVFARLTIIRLEIMGLEYALNGPILDVGVGQHGFIQSMEQYCRPAECASISADGFVMGDGSYRLPFSDSSVRLLTSLFIFDGGCIDEKLLAPEATRVLMPDGVYVAWDHGSRPIEKPFTDAGLYRLEQAFPASFFKKPPFLSE